MFFFICRPPYVHCSQVLLLLYSSRISQIRYAYARITDLPHTSHCTTWNNFEPNPFRIWSAQFVRIPFIYHIYWMMWNERPSSILAFVWRHTNECARMECVTNIVPRCYSVHGNYVHYSYYVRLGIAISAFPGRKLWCLMDVKWVFGQPRRRRRRRCLSSQSPR